MRCNFCNVDLGENYTICPLCGKKSDSVPGKITYFKTAEYPEKYKQIKHEPVLKAKTPLSLNKIKAIFRF